MAAILREILTHPTKKLYDDNTVHLLCSNYWLQPIYQELLHSSSRYNATVTGEKNRPRSGLARISAHPRPPKIYGSHLRLLPDFLTGYWRYVLCGYVAGLVSCPLGSLVIRQLQRKEDECRTANPSWVDQSRLDPTSSGELPGDVPHIEARCHCRGKVPLLGRSPGQRRYKSPCSFPMNILWTTGIQRIMLCPQCGPMSP